MKLNKRNIVPRIKLSLRRTSGINNLQKSIGQSPGTLFYTGKKKPLKTEIEIFSFTETEIEHCKTEKLSTAINLLSPEKSNWLSISGLHQTEVIQKVGKTFNLHNLLLEDVLQVDQRPKFEDFGEHLFFAIKMFYADAAQGGIRYEHLSFVLTSNTLICFQEEPGDLFDLIRDRLNSENTKIRVKKADYVFYRCIDTIVDHYYLVVDQLAEKIESLEDEVMDNHGKNTLEKLQDVRKELIFLRRSIYPLRESINNLIKSESDLIQNDTIKYFLDVNDHCIHVIESLDTYRELLNGIMDLYMNATSNRMNEIMKVLTIMSTIFIPLTFIAGIYGMNFQHMPELAHRWAYPICLGLMLVVAIVLLFFYRRKGWI